MFDPLGLYKDGKNDFMGYTRPRLQKVPIAKKQKSRTDDSSLKMSAVAASGEPAQAMLDEDGNEIKAPQESWRYLLLIVLIGVSNYWQQSIFAYAYSHVEGDPLKAGKPFYEMAKAIPELNDFYFSLIGGVEYRLPLALFSLVAGVLTAKLNRKYFLVIISMVWSCITLVEAQSRSVNDFQICMIMYGVLSAVLNPASLSLIRDYFPPN